MSKVDKEQQAKDIYNLQKALVSFSDRFNNREWEKKTDRERRIDHMANSLLMELHKQVEEQELEPPSERVNREQKLADTFMLASNALRGGKVPLSSGIVEQLDKIVGMVNIANTYKVAAKDEAIRNKIKEL